MIGCMNEEGQSSEAILKSNGKIKIQARIAKKVKILYKSIFYCKINPSSSRYNLKEKYVMI